MANNWAILIGINNYEHHPEKQLKYAVADAQLMRDFLCNYADFDPQKVILCLGDEAYRNKPTYPNCANLLKNLTRQLDPSRIGQADNLWFFFGGHGINRDGRDYLLACDTLAEDLNRFSLPIDEVIASLRKHKKAEIVLITDACRESLDTRSVSARTGEQTLKLAKEQGITTIFSCDQGQFSYENNTLEHGSFTYALVEGLQRHTIPIKLEEYLQQRTPELNRQDNKNVEQSPRIRTEPVKKANKPLLVQCVSPTDIADLIDCATKAELNEDFKEAQDLYVQISQIRGLDQQKFEEVQAAIERVRRKIASYKPQLISPPPRPSSPQPIVSPSDQELQLPEGWIEVTRKFLTQKAQNIPLDLIARYFDVRDPGWEEALSGEIPPRNIVGDLIDTLKRPPERGLRLTVLVGPGCEGKSTALRQAICDLVMSSYSFRVIWWEDPMIAELKTILMLLPQVSNNQRWLIVADNPSRQLIKAIHELFSEPLPRRDIQFLFCCRDTIWQNYGEELTWDQRRTKISMSKLKEDEARKIVKAWKKLGKLANKSEENAVQELLEKQKSEKAAFLAAMLQICEGTTAKERVERILIDIQGKPRAKYVLDAYVCIVAMHKEGLDFLKYSVIAEAIQYNPTQLRTEILEEMGDEIILHDGNKPILTRQQVIAEAAYEILSRPPYSKNFEDDIYPRLAKSAQKLVGSGVIGRKGQEIVNWQYDFPNHFANTKPTPRIDVAIQIAEVLYLNSDYQIERDRRLFTHLAQLYLDNDKFPQSIKLFRDSSFTTRDRKFYHTWAIAERGNGNFLYSVLLCAIALADNTIPMLDGESAMIYLSNAGFAFFYLCNKSADVYAKALGASAKLALGIAARVKYQKDPGDRKKKKTINDLNENIKRSEQRGVTDLEQMTFEQLFQRLKSGLEAASQSLAQQRHQKNINSLPEWVEKFEELQFISLRKQLELTENNSQDQPAIRRKTSSK
ncbi:MAG TPA: caspase family protein [Trichormus sp. M33_DOE_039]|nr:caspase family protein [Trichormus sp. M33_DOE_039]